MYRLCYFVNLNSLCVVLFSRYFIFSMLWKKLNIIKLSWIFRMYIKKYLSVFAVVFPCMMFCHFYSIYDLINCDFISQLFLKICFPVFSEISVFQYSLKLFIAVFSALCTAQFNYISNIFLPEFVVSSAFLKLPWIFFYCARFWCV